MRRFKESMENRKAQVSGSSAAALVLVIAAFVLIYLLLIPVADRDAIIKGSSSSGISAVKGSVVGSVLLDEHPGTVTKLKESEFEHRIPSFNLFIEKEAAVLKKADSVFVESSGTSTRAVPFFVEDRAKEGKLTFSVNEHKGKLAVRFNGEEIFKGEINKLVDPLSLDSIGKENLLEFSVDTPPSWKFWEKNFYDIRNVQVIATVEKLGNREAVNTFFMTKEEADPENIDEAYIIYLADCKASDVGKLGVSINGKLVSSKVPDCGSLEKTFIDPADFVAGKNELKFSTEAGKYLIDQIFVKTKLKKPVSPIYFFDINSTQFRKIENNTINASISLKFVDDSEVKNAVIDVNGHRISVNTRQGAFSKNIDEFVVEGSNSARVEPETTLYVLEMKVELDCKDSKGCS